MNLHRYFYRANNMNCRVRTAAERFEKGIFCDCAGTLFVDGLGDDTELVTYLNAQHASGRKVVLFSEEPQKVQARVMMLGLDPALTEQIHNKRDYQDTVLEVLIDDEPESYLKSVTHHHPHEKSFRKLIRDFSGFHPLLLSVPMALSL